MKFNPSRSFCACVSLCIFLAPSLLAAQAQAARNSQQHFVLAVTMEWKIVLHTFAAGYTLVSYESTSDNS